MKKSILSLGVACVLGLVGISAGQGLAAPVGYVDFGKIAPASSGDHFVEVNIRSNLINMVARLAERSEPEIAELIRGLQAIRVNVVGLTDANRADMKQKVDTIRAELSALEWERIVTVQDKGEDIGVFLKTRGDEAVEGLAVTIINQGKEAILVNIVGNIQPEKVALIGERFDIEPLKKIGPSLQGHSAH